jgi:hypothetical protein
MLGNACRSVIAAVGVALVVAPPHLSARTAEPSGPALDDIVAAARRYVLDYEKALTLIVADESYVQRLYFPGFSSATYPTRVLKSEVFFAFTPSKKEWLAVRDVKNVDGVAVEAGPNVGSLLATLPADEVAASLKAYNARFNIGRSLRNYNEPTLGLLIFDANWPEDLAFELKHLEASHGISVATVAFRERGAPTLITDLDRRPVPSTGEATIELGTGRIRKVSVKTPIGAVLSELETTFAFDAKLNVWLPATFAEHYTLQDSLDSEEVFCRATYSNFRRFEVHGGIK